MKILELVKNPRVLLVGIAYKPDSKEIQNSIAIEIWNLFEKKGVEVSYHDPGILNFREVKSVGLTVPEIEGYDLILITTLHKGINYEILSKVNVPIFNPYGRYL